MSDQEIVVRIICTFLSSLFIAAITSQLIGAENKALWFRKRTKFSIFNRRGFFGETCHFGYPCTWQGFAVTFGMVLAILLVAFILFHV